MSNLLREFFPCPKQIIRDGLLRKMKPGELKLYMLLIHQMERFSAPKISLTNRDIRVQTGLAPRSIWISRIKLKERGLITWERRGNSAYQYVVFDPSTGRPAELQQTKMTRPRPAVAVQRAPVQGVSGVFDEVVRTTTRQPNSTTPSGKMNNLGSGKSLSL
jgi:hypothetical protein